MLPPGSVQRVREAANIATVIQGYTPLRKVGQNLTACCLFHQERTPSMYVSPAKQLFHCKGCGVGGDVISFTMRIDGVSFPAAVRSLAEQYGISLESKVDAATAKRQAAYAAALATDAGIYWQHVRRVYSARFETMKAIAFGASDINEEEIAQRYGRRAWLWGRALRRLDAIGPTTALRGFQRVRSRRDVVMLIARHRQAEAETDAIWGRMIAACREGRVTGDQIWTVAAAVYAGTAEGARGVLGSGGVA